MPWAEELSLLSWIGVVDGLHSLHLTPPVLGLEMFRTSGVCGFKHVLTNRTNLSETLVFQMSSRQILLEVNLCYLESSHTYNKNKVSVWKPRVSKKLFVLLSCYIMDLLSVQTC